MFLESGTSPLLSPPAGALAERSLARRRPLTAPRTSVYGLDSEYGRLESVLLADPQHLSLVPCNSVSRESVLLGRSPSLERAVRQHAGLVAALRGEGVDVRLVPADAGLPDLAFTRDSAVMTPWGLLGLRPGARHRRREVEVVLDAARASNVPVLGRIERGRIEGGDVCVLRPGVLLIGISDERTDDEGAEALAAIFRRRDWEVITYRFDPHFLHLDTLFCLADHDLAMACTDVLDDGFIAKLESLGVELMPVGYKDARRLGCNLLALGDRRVITTGTCSRLDAELAVRGYRAIALDLSEFLMCGGGVHCLTMPLRRAAG